MIRAQVLKTIREALDQPPWIFSEDFAISFYAGTENSVVIILKFVSGDGQYFRATLPRSKARQVWTDVLKIERASYDFDIECEFDPGELLRLQSAVARGEESLISQIKNWVDRIAADIKSAPIARMLLSHEEMIRELEEKLKDAPDKFPTAEQVVELQNAIDRVREGLAVQIAESEKSAAVRDQRIAELEEQMKVLKDRVEHTKIRATIRALAGRVYRVSTSPKAGALIENIGKIVGLLAAKGGAS